MHVTFNMQSLYNILPYIGKHEEQRNVVYREMLLENSLIVIKRHPWFGSVDWAETPEMKELRTGQNIIDVVNTYIRIGLESGFAGMALFIGFFLTVCWKNFRSMRSIKSVDPELYLIGRCLFATLIAMLFIIFTVSSISIIPLIYWSFAAICTSYWDIVRQALKEKSLSNSRPVMHSRNSTSSETGNTQVSPLL